jgi:hypothetical protein
MTRIRCHDCGAIVTVMRVLDLYLCATCQAVYWQAYADEVAPYALSSNDGRFLRSIKIAP